MTAPRKIVNRTKTLLTARWQEILILGWVPLLAGLLKSPPGDWYQTGPWYQNKEDRTGKKSRTAASTGPPDVVMLGSCADGQNDPSSPGQGEGGSPVTAPAPPLPARLWLSLSFVLLFACSCSFACSACFCLFAFGFLPQACRISVPR